VVKSLFFGLLWSAAVFAATPPLDPWFGGQSPVQVTVTESREDPGKPPVVIEIEQLTMRGDKASICNRLVRPDLIPEDLREDPTTNLFFENGMVMEQNLNDKSWVKYKCTRSQFVEYLIYCYTGAGMYLDLAQAAVQDKGRVHFTSTESNGSLTFEPPKGDPDLEAFKSITVRKALPLQFQEVAWFDKPAKYLLRFKYTYDSPDLPDTYPVKPPAISKEIPNPLASRMVYP
jgi:hypothetical protein